MEEKLTTMYTIATTKQVAAPELSFSLIPGTICCIPISF
jgi:hypothetical protein